jgi:hypothetical protein
MPLPKINYPTFKITVPSTKKQLLFRPFLVREEKILLMAKTSKDNNDILSAIKQVVNNCCQENNFDVNKLTIFDLEYLFLKIRSSSVGNMIPLSFKDLEDDREYKFEIDLNAVEIQYPKNANNKIAIDDKTGVIMKYPSASLYDDRSFLSLGSDAMFEVMVRCVDKIYEGDEMHDPGSYSHEELSNFIDGLDVKTFEAIQSFLNDAPSMKHVLTYTNSMGNERKIELTTLNDFFTLR